MIAVGAGTLGISEPGTDARLRPAPARSPSPTSWRCLDDWDCGLGFAIALAMNLLGTLQEMAAVTLQTIRLRGGTQRPWTALRSFLVTTIANTLRYRDDVVNAAAVRAFNPHRGQSLPLPLRPPDLWLLAVLAGCTGILLVKGM